MKNLSNLFKIIELTRSQIQQGYLVTGIPTDRISNLAEHHYMVTFIGWQLAWHLKEAGANIDIQKVMEYCMIHDVGEILGGDISAPYAKMNPKAKELAKAYETENHKFLAPFFGAQQKQFLAMAKEIMDAKTDEALLAKVADYIESTCFLNYLGEMDQKRSKFNLEIIQGHAKKLRDPVAKRHLQNFLADWGKNLSGRNYIEILNGR